MTFVYQSAVTGEIELEVECGDHPDIEKADAAYVAKFGRMPPWLYNKKFPDRSILTGTFIREHPAGGWALVGHESRDRYPFHPFGIKLQT